jgi:hypothetical protein
MLPATHTAGVLCFFLPCITMANVSVTSNGIVANWLNSECNVGSDVDISSSIDSNEVEEGNRYENCAAGGDVCCLLNDEKLCLSFASCEIRGGLSPSQPRSLSTHISTATAKVDSILTTSNIRRQETSITTNSENDLDNYHCHQSDGNVEDCVDNIEGGVCCRNRHNNIYFTTCTTEALCIAEEGQYTSLLDDDSGNFETTNPVYDLDNYHCHQSDGNVEDCVDNIEGGVCCRNRHNNIYFTTCTTEALCIAEEGQYVSLLDNDRGNFETLNPVYDLDNYHCHQSDGNVENCIDNVEGGVCCRRRHNNVYSTTCTTEALCDAQGGQYASQILSTIHTNTEFTAYVNTTTPITNVSIITDVVLASEKKNTTFYIIDDIFKFTVTVFTVIVVQIVNCIQLFKIPSIFV